MQLTDQKSLSELAKKVGVSEQELLSDLARRLEVAYIQWQIEAVTSSWSEAWKKFNAARPVSDFWLKLAAKASGG